MGERSAESESGGAGDRVLREHYLSLLASAPVLIWRADTNASCEWFNQTWLEFTGRTLEQERGDGWTEGVHAEDLERCGPRRHHCFRARRPEIYRAQRRPRVQVH